MILFKNQLRLFKNHKKFEISILRFNRLKNNLLKNYGLYYKLRPYAKLISSKY